MSWPEWSSIVSLTVLVVAVAIFDLRERRIPNFIVMPASLIGLSVHWFDSGWAGLAFSLKGIGIGFVILLIPYLVKGMKAGDVKFMMAIGSFVGATSIIRVLLITLLCYPVLAAIMVIRQGKLKVTWLRFRRILFNFLGFFVVSLRLYAVRLESLDDKSVASATTPFGVAIAIGALISIYTGFLKSIL
ncbi:MAG: prepilin peptidase [Acidobacteria bacterium]|nr:prepilin peptidase [Acidobacteriota bacterium]